MNKLEEIVAYKRQELEELKDIRPLAQIERALKDRLPVRNFEEAIHRIGQLSLIAEVKRASPSAGAIQPEADAVEIASMYADSGAQAVSILTDKQFFSGTLTDLVSVKQTVQVPVLRKDFLVEEYQVIEAAAAGADCILLIVAVLPSERLTALMNLARDLELHALVETHTAEEVDTALDAGAQIIGINNRDLSTMQVDIATTEVLSKRITDDRTIVSESGIHTREEVQRVQAAGAHAILVGESLMKAEDPPAMIKELLI